MKYFCLVCGEELEKTKERCNVKSELGFTISAEIYKCSKCKENFVKCDECEGERFIKNKNGIFDCPKCFGMGILKI